jgi:gamma-glutamyl hercynylcysteine S-oxide hydrolase
MCRHLAYIGPPVTLEKLLLQPPHSLLHQASAPRYQTHGTINRDGFGVGWYDRDLRTEPARYRTTEPIWSDVSFESISGLVKSKAVLAAVRAASPGMPVEERANAPFTEGPWLFSHNGFVPGFRSGVGRALRRKVSEQRANAMAGVTDSELLFGLVLDRLDSGRSPVDTLVSVVEMVEDLTTARLNLLLTDGERIAATAVRNSLFVFDDRQLTGSVVVASEPYNDDATWEAVPDGSVVEFGDDKLETRPL